MRRRNVIILKQNRKSKYDKEKLELLRDIKKSFDDLENGRYTVENY